MRLDYWTNTKTGVQVSWAVLGTPRGWAMRAYDAKFNKLDPSVASQSSIDPREISCGAIFKDTSRLPVIDAPRMLYRFFEIPRNYTGLTGKNKDDTIPVIGVALALKPDEFLEWDKKLRALGAEWIWFGMPLPLPGQPERQNKESITINHEHAYQLFDQGLRVTDVANRLGAKQPAVSYVYKKWLAGKPANIIKVPRSVPLDRFAIIRDLRAGMSAKEIALKYETTPSTVYKIRSSVSQ